jgi:epoxide hydrolase-like predicted phosphatase
MKPPPISSKPLISGYWGGAPPSVILIRMQSRAIIFDLGGVLLRTADFSPRDRLAARMGINRHDLEEFIFGGESGDRAQRGEITVEEHWENLRSQINYSPQDFKALLDEFFADDELDQELIDYVRVLHKSYKTALMSNAWDDLRQVIHEKWHFEDAFDTLIISAEVKLVKPDPLIFRLALEQLGVEASQAIFVDDMRRNVDGAKAVGLHGIRFRTPQQMRFDLEQLLNGCE